MSVLSFCLPCPCIAGFEFSAFWVWFSEERKLILSWGLFVWLLVTSHPKEYLDLLGHFKPDWKVDRTLKDLDLQYFVEKVVWLEEKNTPIRAQFCSRKDKFKVPKTKFIMPFSSIVIGHLIEGLGKVTEFPYPLAVDSFLFSLSIGHIAYYCWLWSLTEWVMHTKSCLLTYNAQLLINCLSINLDQHSITFHELCSVLGSIRSELLRHCRQKSILISKL